jgi:putative CocE/NonD family hydrolase
MDKVPHVRAFVMGANKWVDLADWPDRSEKAETLYLGAGSLGTSVPKKSTNAYTYDPAKDHDISAVAGGAGAAAAEFSGTVDLKNAKQPYLLFRSAPLTHDTAITGPATIDLYFKSSARDTDFFAAIVDIDPAGKNHVFGEAGKIRASYRDGVASVKPLTPGRTYHVRVLPWDFADEIKKGHRIGLLVTPTAFPMFARNLGTGEPPATAKRMVAQHNTLLFGKATPSRMSFEVLWEK